MDAPVGPAGYPPPTLIRKRSGGRRLRTAIVVLTIAITVLIYAASTLLSDAPPAPPTMTAAPKAAAEIAAPADADGNAAAMPDVAAEPPMTVEMPVSEAAPTQPGPDAREPNRWYYVNALGDGPGVIYSRTGGQWNFAFACNARTKLIEFIAVGTGSPGSFTGQSISVGKVKLMMDASYAQEGGGTIITTLPAEHPFFNALDGKAPMEVRLHATRKTIVPIGPDVVRLIEACRG